MRARTGLNRVRRMNWIERLDQDSWNFVIDELVWYLQEGRAPTEIAARLAPQSGVEFCFDGAAPAFFRIEANALREHWPAAMQIIGGFKELGSVVLLDFS